MLPKQNEFPGRRGCGSHARHESSKKLQETQLWIVFGLGNRDTHTNAGRVGTLPTVTQRLWKPCRKRGCGERDVWEGNNEQETEKRGEREGES
jgi:hypothetical protein